MDNIVMAQNIVEKILDNLKDRSGFRHLLESIEIDDPETYQEIQVALTTITLNELGLEASE